MGNRHRKITFLGKEFSSPFFIAASPITSTTVGSLRSRQWEFDPDHLEKKINFILKERFNIGAVILKTVYYPEEKKEDKEKRRGPDTRVWVKSKYKSDLFHVGHTPREMFTVNELIKFLRRKSIKQQADKIIISLGIKSSNINLWKVLFKKMFDKTRLCDYEIIEINARHTLREINMMYLNDRDIDEYVINPVAQSVWNIVFQWLNLLNELGINYKKRFLIKLPFRSDLIILCQFIEKIIEENQRFRKNFGIKGVTLINTIKSPTEDRTKVRIEPHLLLCSEKVKIQQMSGYSLKGIRNWAIRAIRKKCEKIEEISASGGLYSKDDIIEAKSFGTKTFQLCTAVVKNGLEVMEGLKSLKEALINCDNNLIRGDARKIKKRVTLTNNKIGKVETNLKPRRILWEQGKCCRCMRCLKTFYCDAFTNKYLLYYRGKSVKINGTQSFYIPSRFYPHVERKYCTGCGLCIQMCPTGALHYK